VADTLIVTSARPRDSGQMRMFTKVGCWHAQACSRERGSSVRGVLGLPGTGPSVRHLYLDVEGHRNKAGGFDHDAYELITHFVHGYLMQWLTETHTPLGTYRNPRQREDVPDGLDVMPGGDSAEREEMLRQNAEAMGQPIYDSETGEMVDAAGTRRPSRG
jgi:hypothetical protein